jgi:hypothetical protein
MYGNELSTDFNFNYIHIDSTLVHLENSCPVNRYNLTHTMVKTQLTDEGYGF